MVPLYVSKAVGPQNWQQDFGRDQLKSSGGEGQYISTGENTLVANFGARILCPKPPNAVPHVVAF